MTSLKASPFLVECDEEGEAHIYTRASRFEYKEITNEMSDKDKNNLISDLVYAVTKLVKERDELESKVGGEKE